MATSRILCLAKHKGIKTYQDNAQDSAHCTYTMAHCNHFYCLGIVLNFLNRDEQHKLLVNNIQNKRSVSRYLFVCRKFILSSSLSTRRNKASTLNFCFRKRLAYRFIKMYTNISSTMSGFSLKQDTSVKCFKCNLLIVFNNELFQVDEMWQQKLLDKKKLPKTVTHILLANCSNEKKKSIWEVGSHPTDSLIDVSRRSLTLVLNL